ncbi:MAG: EAL domain-containing protein [Salaquimonas sp.]
MQLSLAHADSIERYLGEQIKAFDGHVAELASKNFEQPEFLFENNDNIQEMLIIDSASSNILASYKLSKRYLAGSSKSSAPAIGNLNLPKMHLSDGKTHLSPLIKHANGTNSLYLVRQIENRIIAGEIDKQFFSNLAAGTRIGATGHAAIFDRKGNLLAHPDKSWETSGKNINGLAPVNLAKNGENGIVQFHSPATDSLMLAGVAAVKTGGLGIMIPRSLSDITNQTGFGKRSVSIIFVMILAAILLGTIIVSNFISSPIERLTHVLKKISKTGDLVDFKINDSNLMPTENMELEKTFTEMAKNLRNTHNKMKILAYSDAVTSLPNREAFSTIVEQSLAFMANKDMNGAMLFVDLHNFKEINESHGHSIGDQVLRCLGARFGSILELTTGQSPTKILESNFDQQCTPRASVGRFGGDEFVIFVPENNGFSQLDAITEQIFEAIETPIPGLKTNIMLSGHIGISSFPEHGLTFRDLVKKADIAVFHAKTVGKSRVQRYGDGTGELSASELRREVHFAINNEELELYYQPKVNTINNSVKSVEALVRWFHPKKGLISPADFIPAIENSDTTNELGEWVVKRACQDMKKWDAQGHQLNIAVNISSRQFSSDNFVDRIYNIIIEEDCDPMRFEIEVTEETALSSKDTANNVISQLHNLGFKVSLDDYGRGYSNLTRLSELQVNTIKIDGPLTARLTRDERTRVIFEATINMAKGLKCETVAEGVETAEEVAILTRLGCTELQGFYFATPMPHAGVVNWIEKRRTTPVDAMNERLRA